MHGAMVVRLAGAHKNKVLVQIQTGPSCKESVFFLSLCGCLYTGQRYELQVNHCLSVILRLKMWVQADVCLKVAQ